MRYVPFFTAALLTVFIPVLEAVWKVNWYWLLVFSLPLTILGIWDLIPIRRKYDSF